MILSSIVPRAKTIAQLKAQSRPQQPDELEAYGHVLYSVRTYVSGSTTRLTFFDFVGGPDVTNMESAGQLPDPQFFEIWGVHFGVRRGVTNTPEGITGAIDDVEKLIRSGGGSFILTIGSKNYGPWPLEALHSLGGPTGFGWGLDNTAAGGTPSQTQFANNGLAGSGLSQRGALVVPPKQRLVATVTWPAPLTLTGDVPVYAALSGVHFRDVR
jgi:hypothetical protein